jgi:hypothetical protein
MDRFESGIGSWTGLIGLTRFLYRFPEESDKTKSPKKDDI